MRFECAKPNWGIPLFLAVTAAVGLFLPTPAGFSFLLPFRGAGAVLGLAVIAAYVPSFVLKEYCEIHDEYFVVKKVFMIQKAPYFGTKNDPVRAELASGILRILNGNVLIRYPVGFIPLQFADPDVFIEVFNAKLAAARREGK